MYSWTNNDTYDNLLFTFYVLRIIFLLPVFLLNFVQLIYEVISIIKKEKKVTPRTLAFACCCGYPLFRAFALIVLLAGEGNETSNSLGSLYWQFNVWGTYFIFCLWIFINSYWTKLLFSFFLTNSIILKNQKRVWVASWVFALLIFLFDLFAVICSKVNEELTISFYSKVFIAIAVTIGVGVGLSGILLARFMNQQKARIPQLQEIINRTIKLASILIALFIFLILREIIFGAIKLPSDSNYRYIGTFISSILEYVMVLVVMTALSGGDRMLNYLLFKRIGDKSPSTSLHDNSSRKSYSYHSSHSSKEKGDSINSPNGGSVNYEINSSEFNSTNSSNLTSSPPLNSQNHQLLQQSHQPLLNSSVTTISPTTTTIDIEMNQLNTSETLQSEVILEIDNIKQ